MAKVQFSDVTPPEKRSIRNIPIPKGGKRKPPVIIKPEPTPEKPVVSDVQENEIKISKPQETLKISDLTEARQEGPYEYYYPKNQNPSEDKGIKTEDIKKRGNGKKIFFASTAVVLIGVFVIAMMTVFSSAKIIINPKVTDIGVDMKLTASVDGGNEAVKYEVVKLSKSLTESVPASSEEVVEEKARGKIVIYNNFSSDPQRLIVRTRFETPEGLVYRVPESVTVPGKSVKNGVETPGSIEVEVIADEAGEKYNIKKTDFTVPGFKNDSERYKGFYARSSTDMSGGFIGKRKIVQESDKSSAMQKVETSLKEILEKEMQTKVPAGLTLLKGSMIYEFSELPQKDDSSSATIGKEGVAYAILFDSTGLSNKIISEYIDDYPDWAQIPAQITDFSGLSLKQTPAKVSQGEKLDLEIVGRANMVANIDIEALKDELSGRPRKDTNLIIDNFEGISGATTTVRPVWKQAFPSDPAKIKVEVVQEY